jgi:hypothetical protein
MGACSSELAGSCAGACTVTSDASSVREGELVVGTPLPIIEADVICWDM